MKKRKAFTLVEIMIAMFLMMVVILSIFMLNQKANESSMDSYYEMLCFSLAREPIEVLRSFGYETVMKIKDNPGLMPKQYSDSFVDFADIDINPSDVDNYPFSYPNEALNFQRSITLEDGSENGINYVKVTVIIQPRGSSKAESWMRQKAGIMNANKGVILDSYIMETPKW